MAVKAAAARLARDGVFGVAALAGVVALVWLGFSLATGATIIVFKTGSMSPQMPVGAAAIAVPVAASELEIGDVVTVQRDDASLPVTHRVVELRLADRARAREVVLQGDANATPDLFPYVLERAPRVIAWAPGVGTTLEAAKSPPVMSVLTLIAAALCTWAFWPKSDARPETRRRQSLHRAEPAPSNGWEAA
ncbi:MAG TPA: signal peptidase I [Microbacterium sp.]|nr:signal peptidase I [Microbacterium sp.]